MAKRCPVTGGSPCHCDKLLLPKAGDAEGENALETLRRLLMDHGIYLSALIMNRIPMDLPGSDQIVVRLQNGASDLAEFLAPVVGDEKAEELRQALFVHIDLSGNVIADPNADTIADFVAQGQDELLPAFLALEPLSGADRVSRRPLIKKLVLEHVNIDVELVLARLNDDAARFIDLNDRGLIHLGRLADAVYDEVFE